MIDFGDGREERLAAFDLEQRLKKDPEVTRRREAYHAAVKRANDHARSLGNPACIEALIEHNPAYIRDLLETEDSRFGSGAIADRYARTFYGRFK